MLVTLEIDKKEVQFDTSISWMYIYKAQFQEDPMQMIKPLLNLIGKTAETEGSENKSDIFNNPLEIFDILPLQKVLNVAWALAANADDSIFQTPPLRWFKQFDKFPLDDVFFTLIPAIVQSMVSEKKYSTLLTALKSANLGDQLLTTSTESSSQQEVPASTGTTSGT